MKDIEPSLTTELLILPDGQILVHNLTKPFAELLAGLNPDCEQISSRVSPTKSNDSPPPPFFSRSGEDRDEEADGFQTQIPSPQPSSRSGGQREVGCLPPAIALRRRGKSSITKP